MLRIYSIIDISRVEKQAKRRVKFILKNKLKYYTKEILKYFNIAVIAFGLIIAIILIKYRPVYKVSISGEEIGYIENIQAFEENLKQDIIEQEDKNVDNIDIKSNPEYELKLVNRTLKTNEQEVTSEMEDEVVVTYKYYDIAYKNETIESVNTIEEAEEVVNELKKENENKELDLSIIEKYTINEQEVDTSNIEVAKTETKNILTQKIEEEEKHKAEEERINSLPNINGIKLAVTPVTGTITSRYGVSSRIRKSNHTGLDISAKTGTDIKVVAAGTVISAKYEGSYGNLVKIDHGNGVETWYAHTSKMYVKAGQKVEAGDVIAAVGSTGNSTGPHLHLEIRVNGEHINPQKYLYN